MYNLPPLASGKRSDTDTDPAPTPGTDGDTQTEGGKGEKGERWTLLEVLRWTTARFQQRHLPSARLDAEILIAAALGLGRVQLYVQFDRPLGPEELATIRDFVRRRQRGECVAYIVGKKEFFGLDLAVDARVLVPRPETETLVDEALSRWRERIPAPPEVEIVSFALDDAAGDDQVDPAEGAGAAAVPPPAPAAPSVPAAPSAPGPVPRIADVGTGSGAIVVALGRQLPGSELFAVDLSPGALEVARANAERHGLTVTWLEGDLATPLGGHAPFDLIVANLPYVPSGELASLPPEVRAEPHLALDGGPDGLALVRRLVAVAPGLLAPGGSLVLEIGAGQADAARRLLDQAGFTDARMRRDLGGIDRIVSARQPGPPSPGGAALPDAPTGGPA
jgi:release factor glutamine methyltransferase